MTKRTHEEMDKPEMDFFMNESKSDVVFVIEGQRLPALKQTLSIKSRVFRAMFSGNFSESKVTKKSKLPEIEIKDTTFDAFKTMVRFIYTDEVVFTSKDNRDLKYAFDVYHLSDRYEVLRLGQRIGKYLVSKINVKDLITISPIVSALNNEKLMSKMMTFIEENINEVIQLNLKDLKELNNATNDKLLDVLSGDDFKSNDSLQSLVIEGKTVFIKKEALIKNGLDSEELFKNRMKYRSFDAFKTFVGFLYFDKLILKDEDDLKLIREVCSIFYYQFKCKSFFDCIHNHLKDRITVENLDSISGIAFDYKIKALMKRVINFIEENFTEIFAESNEQIFKINESTKNSLLAVILKNHRKAIQEISDLKNT